MKSTSFPEIVYEVIELAGRDASLLSSLVIGSGGGVDGNLPTVTPHTGSPRGLVLICGTAYFMPQVRAALGINEPR